MATGPGDHLESASRGRLRASHADREQVIGTLKAAFVQGRLAKDELEARAAQALAARTYAELAALTADLPAGLTDAMPARQAAREHPRPPEKAAKAAACVSLALALLAVAVFLGPGSGPERLVGLAVFFLPLCGLSLGGLLMLHSWLEKRADRRQLPAPPASSGGGQAYRHPLAGGPGSQLRPADPGHQQTAEAARRRVPRPSLPGSRSLRRWRPRGLLAGQRPAITHTA